MNIAVIGLGKLGSSIAAVFAVRGHDVYGCDLNENYVNKLGGRIAPVEETGLQDLLEKISPIRTTTDIKKASGNAEIVFIVVPTPSLDDGSFSSEHIRGVLFALAATKSNVDYQIFVVVSTVSPGTMVALRDSFEASTGGTCGKDFGLVYNPEFIALGSVIHDLLNPHFVLIGEEDKRSGGILEKFYTTIHDAPVRRMSFVSAEIAKLGLNIALCQRISYANSISELCENYTGADTRDVLEAIGADKRIGSSYLSPGAAYGGPCFPRDGRALEAAAKAKGCQAWMVEAADEVNRGQVVRIEQIIDRVSPLMKPHFVSDSIGILGLSYKPSTHITEESAGADLFERLKQQNRRVLTYDPQAFCSCRLSDIVLVCKVLVVMTPWPEFQHLPLPRDSTLTIIDAWGIVEQVPDGVTYIRLGVGYGK